MKEIIMENQIKDIKKSNMNIIKYISSILIFHKSQKYRKNIQKKKMKIQMR